MTINSLLPGTKRFEMTDSVIDIMHWHTGEGVRIFIHTPNHTAYIVLDSASEITTFINWLHSPVGIYLHVPYNLVKEMDNHTHVISYFAPVVGKRAVRLSPDELGKIVREVYLRTEGA